MDTSFIYDLYVNPIYVHNRTATPQWGFHTNLVGYHNLLYIYEGKGEFACSGKKKQVKAGDLVYFPDGCLQHMETDKKDFLKLYTVNFQTFFPVFENGKWNQKKVLFPFPFVLSLEDEAVKNRFIQLYERLCRLFLTGVNMQKVMLRQTLIEILELACFCQNSGSISYTNRDKANKAVKYMSIHYMEKISLALLAKTAGLSPSHFSAVFKEVTGKPPIEYLISLRIFRAKQLLGDGLLVSDVAEAVGFSDIFYFSRVFKRLEGISPASFRRECRNQNKVF